MQHIQDALTPAKLHFFVCIVNILTPCLQKFQTYKPMAPFLREEILGLLKTIMTIFIKRILPARGWCATVGGGGTLCKLYPLTPPLRRPSHPVFWVSQPCVPAAWLAERLLLAGDIEFNPGPKPTLKTLSHAPNPHSPSTLAHQSNPLEPAHPHSP